MPVVESCAQKLKKLMLIMSLQGLCKYPLNPQVTDQLSGWLYQSRGNINLYKQYITVGT